MTHHEVTPVTGSPTLVDVDRRLLDPLDPEHTQPAAERPQSYLLALNDRLRPLRDAIEIQTEAVRLLGARLGADWAYYIEYDDDLVYGTIHTDYHKLADAPSLVARYPLGDSRELIAELAAGRTVAEENIQTSPLANALVRERSAAIGLRAYAGAPVFKGTQLIAAVGVAFRATHKWTPLEIAIVQETAARTREAVDRARTERATATELADTKLLQKLSAQLTEEENSTALYEKLVDAAVSILHSDFATFQIFYPERGHAGELRLITSRGFSAEAVQVWEWIGRERHTTCAQALNTEARVVVSDFEQAEFMAGTEDQAGLLKEGARSGQTTPLMSRGGKTVGMISTYWRRTHRPSERVLRLLDLLARQAADLIERTQVVEALRRNEHQLKEADRRKDEFLAVLAHELRNPLAPLRTGVETLRLAGNNPAIIEETRLMMERQLSHMVRLIDDLLDVSRITSGKIQLQRRPTALSELVNDALEANRDALVASGITLTVELPGTPTLVDVDPTRFVQILFNVVHNAVKFARAGRIRVTANVEAGDRGNEVRIVVADSGAGISADLLPRVFELFAQDKASTYGTRPGLGIGLALARQLIEMHGGSIAAHSDGPGLGSVFTIRVPLSPAVAIARSVTPARETPPIRRRVVVIDDNVDGAVAMKRLISALGGECRVAYNGEAGIAEVLEFRPEIVFLDIGMPGLDGYEVCRRIRKEVGANVFVVALTGWGQEQNKQDAARAGFDVHLTKPADPRILQAMLATGRSTAPI
ncbi:MAG TPA: ATP-binding protein [Gemmatimonadaceae bacterium]|nr:ATP-binding protein [Gemmatimonadaceae bacterium]